MSTKLWAGIDAEAAHANDIRYLLVAEKQRRDAAFNLATFAVGGALATAGAAMQLTRGLDHAGNARKYRRRWCGAYTLSPTAEGRTGEAGVSLALQHAG